jgi:hypothetical protein
MPDPGFGPAVYESTNSQAVARLHLLPVFGPRPIPASLITSETSIKAALQPMKLFEGIGKGGCEVGSGFVVQPL